MKLTGFWFDVFPDNIPWNPTRHTEKEHRQEVLVAGNRKHPHFG